MRISDWSSDVCSSDLELDFVDGEEIVTAVQRHGFHRAAEPGRAPRDNLLFAGDQRHVAVALAADRAIEIGRASCSERVCPHVSISMLAVSFKKTNTNHTSEPTSTPCHTTKPTD